MKKLFIAVVFLLGVNVISFAQHAGEWRIRLNATWLVSSGSTNNFISYIEIPAYINNPSPLGSGNNYFRYTGISFTKQKILPELNATWFFVNRFSADVALGLPENVLLIVTIFKSYLKFTNAVQFIVSRLYNKTYLW